MALSSITDDLPQEILDKYRSKLVSAEAAARLINSGDRVFASGVNSGAVELLNALCERKAYRCQDNQRHHHASLRMF